MFEIPELKNHYLRQVAWAIFSPRLLNHPLAVEYVRDEAHYHQLVSLLQKLDTNHLAVNAHFDKIPKKPLGKYFEALLHYILERDERYEVILKNHQIIEDKRTIGEIDLILRDTISGKLEHWELSVKFYLHHPSKNSLEDFIGPNAKDQLDLKFDKLIKHQLPLSSHKQIQYLIESESFENKLLTKGQLFNYTNTNNLFPPTVNQQCKSGWWIRLNKLSEALTKAKYWFIADKTYWIGTNRFDTSEDLKTKDEILDLIQSHFKTDQRSVMLLGLEDSDSSFIEITRGFVTKSDWPSNQNS